MNPSNLMEFEKEVNKMMMAIEYNIKTGQFHSAHTLEQHCRTNIDAVLGKIPLECLTDWALLGFVPNEIVHEEVSKWKEFFKDRLK